MLHCNVFPMTRKRVRGFVFETYKGDHPPYHVHIFRRGKYVGRWDIEHQRPLDNFEVSAALHQALALAEYLKERKN